MRRETASECSDTFFFFLVALLGRGAWGLVVFYCLLLGFSSFLVASGFWFLLLPCGFCDLPAHADQLSQKAEVVASMPTVEHSNVEHADVFLLKVPFRVVCSQLLSGRMPGPPQSAKC